MSDISKLYNDKNIDNIDSIMIVAHPDDESLWGGSYLIKEDYLVVCVTCGIVENRQREFETAMGYSLDDYISLSYVDLTNKVSDSWDDYYDSIKGKIKKILE